MKYFAFVADFEHNPFLPSPDLRCEREGVSQETSVIQIFKGGACLFGLFGLVDGVN